MKLKSLPGVGLLILLATCFAGCETTATTPPAPLGANEARATGQTPDQPTFSALPARDGCVQLYLLRPKQFFGSGIKPLVIIDGVELGRLAGGRSMALYIRPGIHTFETKLSWSNLPMKGGTQQIEVADNGALYLCYSPDYSASEKPGYIVYRNGFVMAELEFSIATIKQSTPLTLDPEVLLKAKPKT